MIKKNEQSSIRISKSTREILARIGRKSESYDSILLKLLAHVDACDRWWSDRDEK